MSSLPHDVADDKCPILTNENFGIWKHRMSDPLGVRLKQWVDRSSLLRFDGNAAPSRHYLLGLFSSSFSVHQLSSVSFFVEWSSSLGQL